MNGKQFTMTVAAIAIAIVLAGVINAIVIPKLGLKTSADEG